MIAQDPKLLRELQEALIDDIVNNWLLESSNAIHSIDQKTAVAIKDPSELDEILVPVCVYKLTDAERRLLARSAIVTMASHISLSLNDVSVAIKESTTI